MKQKGKSDRALGLPHPKIIHMDITGRCNLNCIHCRSRADLLKDIPKDKLALILNQLSVWRKDVEWFELGGGEPLLYVELPQLIKQIKSIFKKAKILLVSNGIIADRELLSTLKKAGLDRIQFSLDGAYPETHNCIRQSAISYQRVQEASASCRELGIPFALRMTVMKGNIKEVEPFFEVARKWGADEVGLRAIILAGNASSNSDNLSVSSGEYNRLLIELPCLSSKYGIKYFSGDPLAIVANKRLITDIRRTYNSCEVFGGCLVGISYIFINNKGDVAFCPMLNTLVIGDPSKIALERIWADSKIYQRMRERDLKGRCGSCTFSKLCGGCRANSYLLDEDLFGENPMCELYEKQVNL